MIEELYIGKKLRVRSATPEKADAKWLQVGDVVEVKGIYPHIILVERLKPVAKDGWKMRQCYGINTLDMFLEEVEKEHG